MTFVFLLTFWYADTPQVYVLDYGLTGEDCIALLEEYAEIEPDYTVAVPSCELDFIGV